MSGANKKRIKHRAKEFNRQLLKDAGVINGRFDPKAVPTVTTESGEDLGYWAGRLKQRASAATVLGMMEYRKRGGQSLG